MSDLPEQPDSAAKIEKTDLANPEVQAAAPTATASAAPKVGKKIFKISIYAFAALGLLVVGFIAFFAIKSAMGVKKQTLDQAEMIDMIMTRTYGKYSDQQKGWLFVGPGNTTYLMRVVQQAKIESENASDELYFVASGASVSSNSPNNYVYGVFQIRVGDKPGDSFMEYSDPMRYDSSAEITPEKVHFEALSDQQWAWDIKVQSGNDPKAEVVRVKNLMLASHGGEIVKVAEFPAAADSDPGMSCDAANDRYKKWTEQGHVLDGPASQTEGEQSDEHSGSDADKSADNGAMEQDEGDGEDNEPMRCNKARWTYATSPVSGPIPGPLTITFKGTKDGEKQQDKSWKLIFDSKGYAFPLPKELADMMMEF